MTSQNSASSHPPPKANPLTAAIIGFLVLEIYNLN